MYADGGEIKFDRVFEKVTNYITDPIKLNIDMKLESMNIQFNNYLVNGDHASDPIGFEGLKKRVAGMPSRQSVYFAGAAAAALDPTASAANARAFFNKITDLVRFCNSGDVAFLLCNEGIQWGLAAVARYISATGGNWLDTTQDVFEREIQTFKGIPLIDAGYTKDQSTEIITETETAGDAGSDATSIYAVSTNEESGMTGIELGPIEVWDPLNGGEQESTPTKLMRIEWWLGLSSPGSHGIARGRNVEGAANWT